MIVLVLLLNIAFTVQTNSRNKAHMKSKARSRNRAHSKSRRHQSMMEYMNTFFSDSADSKNNFNLIFSLILNIKINILCDGFVKFS